MGDLVMSREAGDRTPIETVKVWDPFVRFFHWSLVALIIAAFLTGDEAEKAHITIGYAIVALVAARVIWGFVGPEHARFTDFVKSPGAIAEYLWLALRNRAPRHIGHNPLGGAMVVGLLVMLGAVCGGGYLLTTDGHWEDETFKELHEATAYLLLAMVGMHIVGAIWTGFAHKENLIKAMITGRKAP